MKNNKATQQLSNKDDREMKTLVLWDINGCPIPDGYDPRLVGPRIESALKKSGYAGSLTITAIGDLTKIPGDDVLRELSSTGIALEHAHEFQTDLYEWAHINPSPAAIMLISDPSQLESLARTLYGLEQRGYTILLAYPQRDPAPDWLWKSFLRGVQKEWLWKSLLEDEVDSGSADNKHETTRLVLPDLCPETGESPWSCSVCFFAGHSFDDLTTHLKSVKHAYSEWDLLASHQGVDRFEVKPPPPNDDPDTIKEWELMNNASMDWRMNMIKMSQSKGPGCFSRQDDNTMIFIPQEKWHKDENETAQQYEYEEEEEKTLVLWHINSCPVPDGYDSRLVRPRIESALKNSGYYNGPLTITAIGNLTHTPGDKVLRELSSTGIALKHAHDIQSALYEWTRCNPSPDTIMLISGPCQLECLAPALDKLDGQGYTILLAYPQRDPAPDWLWKSFLRGVQKEWLWKNLLEEGEIDSGSAEKTGRLVLQDKCSETSEYPWSCSVCDFAGQSFEDFTTHLKSREHAYFENFKKSKTDEEEEAEEEDHLEEGL